MELYKNYKDAKDICNKKNIRISKHISGFKHVLRDYEIKTNGRYGYYVNSFPYFLDETLKNMLSFGLWKPKKYFIKFKCGTEERYAIGFTISKRLKNNKVICYQYQISDLLLQELGNKEKDGILILKHDGLHILDKLKKFELRETKREC